jgi:hypothetical protein
MPSASRLSRSLAKASSNVVIARSPPPRNNIACATQAAIRAREENLSFLRNLAMWFSTVRSEMESSWASQWAVTLSPNTNVEVSGALTR